MDIEGCYWLGNCELKVQNLLNRACLPGSVFYDIGASLGFFSLAVANCGGWPKDMVFAFELEPGNCLRLKEMAIRNNLQDHLRLGESAVWSCTSRDGVPFRRGGSQATYGGVLADGVAPVLADGELRLTSTVSLDDFLHQGNPAPDVLKIDVEGGECEVLRGGEKLFSRRKPTVICEVHRQEAATWIENWLAHKGYVAEWQVPEELYPRLLFARRAQPPSHRLGADYE
jgi:FkbM family methyltransferase